MLELLTQDQTQSQQLKIDPRIIIANNILQLSGMELQQAIEQELAENPALEQEDEEPCSGCELAPLLCKDCQHNRQRDQEFTSEDVKTTEMESIQEPDYIFEYTVESDEQTDPIGFVGAEVNLHEHLRNQLGGVVSGKIHEVADYLVNYIDDSGYLRCDLLEVTLELDATDDEIAEAVTIIQTLDPPGVGAMDLRQCMKIQLRYLAEDGRGNRIAERIVSEFWEEMKSRKFSRIARRLKVQIEHVMKALEFIRTKLTPYPAAAFRLPWDDNSSDAKSAVRPDVIIYRTPIGFQIEVVTNESAALTINPYYRQMYNDLRNGRSKSYSKDDRKHVMEFVERADLFIKNLGQRRKTLKAITKFLVENEIGFFETGSKLFLRPLTRVKVAKALRMHESTISRATANKYAQLPNEEVVSFDFFFQMSHSIGDVIAQMIANEDPAHPLSDLEIAQILTQQGYPVARRTVVKYREGRKLLSSRQRRK